MREILFRGKRTDNGEWVYGWLGHLHCHNPRAKTIESVYFTEITEDHNDKMNIIVDYNTVGQYTGLTDKNGTKIYEGDILKYYVWGAYECFAVVRIGEYEQDGSGDEYPAIKICGVYAEVKKYCPLIKEDGDYFPEYLKKSSLLEIGKDVFELVGNIHDNPELLKGGAE